VVAKTLGNGRSLVQSASIIDSAMTTGRKRPGFVEILTVATHSHQPTARSSLGTVTHQLRPPPQRMTRDDTNLTSTDTTERNTGMLRLPLVPSTGRAGYRSELRVVLVAVAAG
jgi:hypothetical protein